MVGIHCLSHAVLIYPKFHVQFIKPSTSYQKYTEMSTISAHFCAKRIKPEEFSHEMIK